MNPSFLDFGIAKGLANLTEMVVIDALSIDHLPIYFNIRDLKRIQPNDFRYSYEDFDFREYRKRLQDLTRITNRIDTVEALERAVKDLAKNIQRTQQAVAKNVPNRPRRDNLPEEILDLINAKNRIRKRWQRFRQSADRLLYKLFAVHSLPLYLVFLLASYLKNRPIHVKVENSTSAKRRIAAGVPQGTVILPVLYTLYTADISKLSTTKIAQYADDTAIYASSFYAQVAKSRIAHHLSLLTPYFDKWKLKVNPGKTELIIFSRKFTNNKILAPLMVQNTPIKPVKEVK
ncbi:hypothetical protein YQE_09509, partial [Dendroctonus ponderosae]